ncbi:hypothetical protein I311_06860 [Cryptococcus gattii NT-10]|nr:hypothetical protein I311_06860 [Cryptococcus gattii NT-10]
MKLESKRSSPPSRLMSFHSRSMMLPVPNPTSSEWRQRTFSLRGLLCLRDLITE